MDSHRDESTDPAQFEYDEENQPNTEPVLENDENPDQPDPDADGDPTARYMRIAARTAEDYGELAEPDDVHGESGDFNGDSTENEDSFDENHENHENRENLDDTHGESDHYEENEEAGETRSDRSIPGVLRAEMENYEENVNEENFEGDFGELEQTGEVLEEFGDEGDEEDGEFEEKEYGDAEEHEEDQEDSLDQHEYDGEHKFHDEDDEPNEFELGDHSGEFQPEDTEPHPDDADPQGDEAADPEAENRENENENENADEEENDEDLLQPLATIDDISAARLEREKLLAVNKQRQKQIALYLQRERYSKNKSTSNNNNNNNNNNDPNNYNPPTHNPLLSLDPSHSDYASLLTRLTHLYSEIDQKRSQISERIDLLTATLDAEDQKCTELNSAFMQFKREIAKESRHSRTNLTIKLKRILAFESMENAKNAEIQELRLRHLNLLAEIKQMEQTIAQREKLADGLHLIDFEQLKIENQTLNEKIEERNDELHKLRKKTTGTVQILTHMKEKFTHVFNENRGFFSELEAVQAEVDARRDALNAVKRQRDALRKENADLKQKQGFIGSDLLVNDYETRKDTILALQDEVDRLKQKYAQLNALVQRGKAVEQQGMATERTLRREEMKQAMSGHRKQPAPSLAAFRAYGQLNKVSMMRDTGTLAKTLRR